jgi:hypothetical protein
MALDRVTAIVAAVRRRLGRAAFETSIPGISLRGLTPRHRCHR